MNVVIPRNLSEEQRDLLDRFAATLEEHNLAKSEQHESLFSRVKRALS